MDPCKPSPIRRLEAGRFVSAVDSVVQEARIELDLNDGELRVGMLCLPLQLEALAIGFLLGEGILRREDLRSVQVDVEGQRVSMRGDFDADAMEAIHRRWTWGTGCGSGGTSRDLNNPPYAAVGAEVTMGAQAVLELAKAFQSRSGLWRETGGVHACALADEREILVFAEDVGRHNAFDKVMGIAAMEGIAVGDKLVLTTGRLSAEIVSKAVACGVPILASRSAVTGLAISLAKRFGMTLVGFMRGGRLNVYSGYERLTGAG